MRAWTAGVASAVLAGCSAPGSADLPILPATVEDASVDLPVVQVTAAGKTLLALIDTGSSTVVVSSKLYGLPDGAQFTLPSICFGTLCSGEVDVEALETPFSTADGIQMIVGMSVLGSQPLEIDHSSRVRLGPLSAGCDAPLVAIDPEQATGRPFVSSLQVAGRAAPSALVDTGSVYVLLDSASSADLPAEARAGAVGATLCTIDGCTPGAFVATSPSVCIGTTCASDVPVKYPAFVGVGQSLLSRYRVRFDFSGNTLQLCDPSPGPSDAGAGEDADDGAASSPG